MIVRKFWSDTVWGMIVLKRFLITLLICILCIPLALGGVLLVSYIGVDEASVPDVTVTALGRTVRPSTYEWHVPLFAGMMFKDMEEQNDAAIEDMGVLTGGSLALEYPQGYITEVTLQRDGGVLFSGNGDEWNKYSMYVNGTYVLDVTCTQPQGLSNQPWGHFNFRIIFQLDFEPKLETSPLHVEQGDVLAIRLSFLQEGVVPTAVVPEDLRITPFISCGAGMMIAYVPTNWTTSDLEEYPIQITAGNHSWEIVMTVQWIQFPRQDLDIDTSDPVIGEANSQKAYDEYNATIPPLWKTYDTEKYWLGNFMRPVTAPLSTEYGTRRYTNGQLVSSFHQGQDLAASEGTAIAAPASGRVIFADYLLNTGYTIVIEHGGGLQTQYFHMSDIWVSAGDVVYKGDQIGAVGTTGYSTGPHLHFEVRVAGLSVNPSLLYSGQGGLMFFETGY